jgi:hypothetical protein
MPRRPEACCVLILGLVSIALGGAPTYQQGTKIAFFIHIMEAFHVAARIGSYSDELVFNFDWTAVYGDISGNDRAYSIAFDSQSNPVIVGLVQGNASFGLPFKVLALCPFFFWFYSFSLFHFRMFNMLLFLASYCCCCRCSHV